MNEVIVTLASFIDDSLLYWIPALILIGYGAKHCSKYPNKLIPFLEVGVGALIGVLFGLAKAADGGAFGGFLSIIEFAGQGALTGVMAIALYDMVHGVVESYLKRNVEEN